MATYVRGIIGRVQRGEAKSDRRTFPFEVGTDEAQDVSVRKPGEGSFETVGDTNSTASQVDDVVYELEVDPDDIDGLGIYVFKSEGATDTQYVAVEVVEYDPYSEGAMSDLALKHRASTPG